MNKLLLIGLLVSSSTYAEVTSQLKTGIGTSIFGTQCIGGHLFAFMVKKDSQAGVSLVQIFKDGDVSSSPNDPIECEETHP